MQVARAAATLCDKNGRGLFRDTATLVRVGHPNLGCTYQGWPPRGEKTPHLYVAYQVLSQALAAEAWQNSV